ncbi:thiamine-phosphate kinase [Psittacicella melopsittaci]|uniref:Thiamine-monophosphate kinase n=1 Tax=Psittacicella melopsittaci TaxID=2028576 RepID=A0A3A1Y5I2_9GAMM|nr:thiamine-phosphate kinase [Psittacicella melopsittaci]RIY32731.1 thiamine-phosphate kinase [Psittacicella melopsittaci]
MALSEFALIKQYFAQATPTRYFAQGQTNAHQQVNEVITIGDDCAVLQIQPGYDLLVTTDTMVQGSHFYPEIHPYDLGYKSVITNLSDIVSCGGIPTWLSLALTLPQAHPTWLEAFSAGIFDALNTYNVKLIGGDTVQGSEPSITMTAQGTVDQGKAFTRAGAKVGDRIYVTGTLGGAYAGFKLLEAMHNKAFANYTSSLTAFGPALEVGISSQSIYQSARFPLIQSSNTDYTCFMQEKNPSPAEQAFYQDLAQTLILKNLHPQTWVKLIQRFHGYVNAAMDLSDGLYSDLRHILNASQVHAQLDLDALPAHPYLEPLEQLTDPEQILLFPASIMALKGGEDYQILFTVPESKAEEFTQVITQAGLLEMIQQIGTIVESKENQAPITYYQNNQPVNLEEYIYEHLYERTQNAELAQQAASSLKFEHFTS